MFPSGSPPSKQTLRGWATGARAFCSELRTSGRLIDVSASLSWPHVWPTACTSDSRSSAKATTTTGPLSSHTGMMLTDAIRSWPTPTTAPDAENRGSNVRRGPASLGPMAKGWASPCAGDSKKGADPSPRSDGPWPRSELPTQAAAWATPVASPRANRTHKEAPSVAAGSHGAHLSTQAVLFPTPAATRYGSSQNGINGRGGENERPSAGTPSLHTAAAQGALPSLRDPTTSTGGERTCKHGRKLSLRLNPAFVAALMGFPIDWCAIE